MKCNKTRSRIVAIAIASSFLIPTAAFAGDPSKLLGKNLGQNRNLVSSAMQGRNYVLEVDKQGKIKSIVDTGANGDGQDAQQTMSANSPSTGSAPPKAASVELPQNYQGQTAIDYLGGDLPKIAAKFGLTADKLEQLFLTDNTVRIDNNNRIFYIDNEAGQKTGEPVAASGATTTLPITTNPTVPIASQATLANAFKLHSKPGASKTIYLDFDGHTVTNTAWSSGTIVAPAYDLGGNPAVFDNNELSNIISIWNRVSEDYIPFDVDVTTEPPSTDALMRTSTADTSYGTRVVITKTGTINCTCGGVAYVGVVSMVNNNAYQPAWVFQQSLANNEKYIAEAVSHEAGHTLGLFHDGQKIGTTVNAYYGGHGAGETSWAPIMGVGYYKNVTQWSAGVYPGANNQQDDIAVLASNGILPRADAVGNTFATASSLTDIGTGSTANIQTFGVIETSADVDMYMVNTAGGAINVSVSPATSGPNLDTKATLYKADGSPGGAIVVTSAPETGLSANINTTVPAGTYFLSVSGSAHSPVGSDYGYPTYASLGQYKISGTYAPASIAVAPSAALTASTLSGPAALTVNFSATASVGNGNIIGYQWSFGDGATSTSVSPVHTYTTVGTFTASLTVTNQYLLTSTKTVQVSVTAPPLPTVQAASLSMSVIKSNMINAQVTIKVVNAQGFPVTNAVVNGTWSGAFTGTLSGKTAVNGNVVLTSNAISAGKGGSGIFTLNGIAVPGYTYNPNQNAKNLITVAW